VLGHPTHVVLIIPIQINTEIMVEAIALCLIDRADLALTAISVPGFTRKNRFDIRQMDSRGRPQQR
jgi:hypothetical protein